MVMRIENAAAAMGRIGGKKRAQHPDRARLASEAASARWKKYRELKAGTVKALPVPCHTVPCHTVPNASQTVNPECLTFGTPSGTPTQPIELEGNKV